MALRGNKKPTDKPSRLKLLMSGPAGVGKTTAAIKMPKPYLIDTENGSAHYGKQIEENGGAVFASSDVTDVISEVRSLMTEKHDYRTLIIDPVTTLFNQSVDEGERLVGTEFGRHYGHANKMFKRLCSLLTAIDMNVIVTAHEKKEYGDEMKVVGMTFDGYKKLDYIFDLWLQLDRVRGETLRHATVMKTRLPEFPDQERFGWGYEELVKRYGKERMEGGIKTVDLATSEQVARFNALYERMSEEERKSLKIDKALASVSAIEDLPQERMAKAIKIMDDHLNGRTAA